MSEDATAPPPFVTPALVGIALPSECVRGVAENLAALAAHLRLLEAPETPAPET